MKHSPLTAAITLLTGTLLGLSNGVSVQAQTPPINTLPERLPATIQNSGVASAIAYPNSSQRFFEAGQRHIEHEIRQLHQTTDQTTPLLTVQPAEITPNLNPWQGIH